MRLFAGRFVAYAIFGAVAGVLGAKIVVLHRPLFTILAHLLSGAFLLLSAILNFNLEKGCAAGRWVKSANNPFLLGVITGINFCPSFLVALTQAILLSGVWAGMLFFISFFIGTSIYMFPLSLLGIVADKKSIRALGRMASVVVGTWLILSAISILRTSLHPTR
jgi:sulfite exporter TauE/SafE